jgi:hypothetical protein
MLGMSLKTFRNMLGMSLKTYGNISGMTLTTYGTSWELDKHVEKIIEEKIWALLRAC